MATINIDGKELEVNGAHNLLQACLSLGLDIPYFCWHPAIGSVGSCRACAVKQYNTADDMAAGRGRLSMSCMTPIADKNTFISIDDKEAKAFRASVVEFLMTNHPHDCPVCEEGGHCHLQDMTVMTGHDRRRYKFTKRTHNNQELGPFIAHEMNRCIACYRCVRYYQDYAGGNDLGVFGSSARVYFGRDKDGVLESEFSGNLVEMCPTGVFTDKTHSERYNRKWDMQYAPSICQQCSVGCNTSPGERYGEVRRIENRFNGAVNHYFLCDRGRFGVGFTNNNDRPKKPQQRVAGKHAAVGVDVALDHSVNMLKGKKVLGIGSARASLETNYALRELVGVANFCTGMTRKEQQLVTLSADILRMEGINNPSLRDIESYDAVLVLGEDVTQTAPRIALAIRQAASNKATQMATERKTQDWLAEPVKRIAQRAKSPIFVISPHSTRLDDIVQGGCIASSNDIARLGFAIASSVKGETVTGLSDEATAFAKDIALQLKNAKKALIVSGTSLQYQGIIEAAASIAQAIGGDAGLSLVVPEVNSMGVALLGGQCLEDAIVQDYDALVIVENDLYHRLPKALARQVLTKTEQVIVIDHQLTNTAKRAATILPAASFAESDGTVVSNEGRAQRYFQVYDPIYYDPLNHVKASWRWLHTLKAEIDGNPVTWHILDDVIEAMARSVPLVAGAVEAAPDAGYRMNGLKIAREPRRYSGRTSMRAAINVNEPRASQDADTGLTFSMEGYVGGKTNSAMIPFAWAPGWNSPSSWNKFQVEVGGHLQSGDAGVRLFDTLAKLPSRSFVAVAAENPDHGSLQIIPQYSIFGSDELSAKSKAIQSRMVDTPIAITLNNETANVLGVDANSIVNVNVGHENVVLSVHISEDFPISCVGYPMGRAPAIDLTASATITVASAAESELQIKPQVDAVVSTPLLQANKAATNSSTASTKVAGV